MCYLDIALQNVFSPYPLVHVCTTQHNCTLHTHFYNKTHFSKIEKKSISRKDSSYSKIDLDSVMT